MEYLREIPAKIFRKLRKQVQLIIESQEYDVCNSDGHKFLIVYDTKVFSQAADRCNMIIKDDHPDTCIEPIEDDDIPLIYLGIQEDTLDKSDYWGYGDAYQRCIKCNQAISITPANMWWTPDHLVIDAEGYVCGDCVRANVDLTKSYVQTLIDSPQTENTIITEEMFKEMGFEMYRPLYMTRTEQMDMQANPHVKFPGKSVVFDIKNTIFTVWHRPYNPEDEITAHETVEVL